MESNEKIAAADEQALRLITGCSPSFGRDLAKHLSNGGSQAVVAARNPDELTSVSTNSDSLHLKLDATHPSQIDAAAKFAEGRSGGIDLLMNKSVIGYYVTVEEGEEAQIRKMSSGWARCSRLSCPA